MCGLLVYERKGYLSWLECPSRRRGRLTPLDHLKTSKRSRVATISTNIRCYLSLQPPYFETRDLTTLENTGDSTGISLSMPTLIIKLVIISENINFLRKQARPCLVEFCFTFSCDDFHCKL